MEAGSLTIKSSGPEATRKIGEVLGGMLGPGDVVALFGELGAGKTCITQGIARGLAVDSRVTSPTYTIIREYNGRFPLYHMDAYRISGPGELDALGAEEYFYGRGVTVIEWADKLKGALPDGRLEIHIGYAPDGETGRVLCISGRGERFSRIIEELREACGFSG